MIDKKEAINIAQNMDYKEESYYDSRWWIEATEVLANPPEWKYIPDILNSLEENNMTFVLFDKMLSHAFILANKNKSKYSVNAYVKDLENPQLLETFEKTLTLNIFLAFWKCPFLNSYSFRWQYFKYEE